MDDAADSSYSVRPSARTLPTPDGAIPIVRRKLLPALALCPVLMASRCIEPAYVGVAQGPEPDYAPTFQFSYRRELLAYVEEFQVVDCDDPAGHSPMWRVIRDGQTPTDIAPLRLPYGQVPRGYRETAAPEPLEPGGCYEAWVEVLAPVGLPIASLPGAERFRLLPNRQLVIGYSAGLINNTRAFRQLNRAAVGCTRGWRRAHTAADSAVVAAREHPVLDARVSCGWLFSEWRDVVEEPLSTERAGLTLAGLLAVFVALGLLLEQIPEVPR